MLAQHVAHRQVAPAGFGAAEEEPLGIFVLPAADHGLQRGFAVHRDELPERHLVVRHRWPLLGNEQRMQLAVAAVRGQRLRKIVEVAIEVDVLVRGAAQVREAPCTS